MLGSYPNYYALDNILGIQSLSAARLLRDGQPGEEPSGLLLCWKEAEHAGGWRWVAVSEEVEGRVKQGRVGTEGGRVEGRG